MKKVTIQVKGMHCKSCETLLTDVLEEIPGTKVLSADYQKGILVAQFQSDPPVEKIKQVIKNEGYDVEGFS